MLNLMPLLSPKPVGAAGAVEAGEEAAVSDMVTVLVGFGCVCMCINDVVVWWQTPPVRMDTMRAFERNVNHNAEQG